MAEPPAPDGRPVAWQPSLFVDLTRPLTPEALLRLGGGLVGDGPPTAGVGMSYLRSYATDQGMICEVRLSDHLGTHVDAPLHILADGDPIDRVPPLSLFGEATVLDLVAASRRPITAADLAPHDGAIRSGDIVLLHTDEREGVAGEFITDQSSLAPDGAAWLAERAIKAVGLEAWGVEDLYRGIVVEGWYDPATPPDRCWPAHKILMRRGIVIIEGLASLASLVGQRVKFAALPLPFPGGSGSPVRAVAWRD